MNFYGIFFGYFRSFIDTFVLLFFSTLKCYKYCYTGDNPWIDSCWHCRRHSWRDFPGVIVHPERLFIFDWCCCGMWCWSVCVSRHRSKINCVSTAMSFLPRPLIYGRKRCATSVSSYNNNNKNIFLYNLIYIRIQYNNIMWYYFLYN